MKTIPELKTYEIKLLKKYCEKIIYSFRIAYSPDTIFQLRQSIDICDEELLNRSK